MWAIADCAHPDRSMADLHADVHFPSLKAIGQIFSRMFKAAIEL
jgi:hypothetical protein